MISSSSSRARTRRGAATSLVAAALVLGAGGTSYGVNAARPTPDSSATSAAATTASGTASGTPSSAVRALLRDSYRPHTQRLSGGAHPALDNERRPSIDAARPRVGDTLEVDPGRWSPEKVRVSYQWFLDEKPVRQATGQTVRVTARMLGDRVSVLVTAKKRGYRTASVSSAQTRAVRPGKLVVVKAPTLVGKPAAGERLRVDAGAWRGNPDLAFEWLAGGRTIKKATGSSIRLTRAQAGKRISVVVTATRDGFETERVTTRATRKVAR